MCQRRDCRSSAPRSGKPPAGNSMRKSSGTRVAPACRTAKERRLRRRETPLGFQNGLQPAWASFPGTLSFSTTLWKAAPFPNESPNTTKPGWLARLSVCGTGSVSFVSMADPECQNLPRVRRNLRQNFGYFRQFLPLHGCRIFSGPDSPSATVPTCSLNSEVSVFQGCASRVHQPKRA